MEKRLLAVSDIHGCYEEFKELLDLVNYCVETDQLVLLGDYVDRGPSSFEVVELVMELVSQGAVALKGNHDSMFVQWYQGTLNNLSYYLNGGDATIKSYRSVSKTKLQAHLAFLRNIPLTWETDDYFFVHAGLNPAKQSDDQEPEELLWIREEWLYTDKSPIDKIVVFGHSVVSQWFGCEGVYVGNKKMGINTGAGCGGFLSIVDLGNEVSYSLKDISSLRTVV